MELPARTSRTTIRARDSPIRGIIRKAETDAAHPSPQSDGMNQLRERVDQLRELGHALAELS